MLNTPTLFALFGLLLACSLPAQKAAYGLQGSIFLSTPELDEVHYDFSARAGFTGGVFFRIPVLKGLFLQPEADFARRPLRGTYSYETYNALDPRVTLDYAADQNIWELGGVLLYQF